ncbi:lipocalin-like domain-containing protein [Glacieibacterium megasporae]|uniref:lipocalin-like domain-containing protein n=1 Tax=Glacieibacterium megasporae TaxID=2835787 RepID=UPI001C1E88CA|nr:lipocalin-like domain-containing protein [Polymorphobacter megasporae]UAJ09672.1 lipocalin-like domain-containing protein [Polymorphobacter megasporae]
MTDDALIGTWLLRSHQVEDRNTGERTEPFGSAPSGVLIVLADGRMSALITGQAVGDAGAPLIAYSGHYRVPSPGSFITAVDVASIAPWVGTEQARSYTVDGDRLELSTAPARMPNPDGTAETRVGRMVWVRETTAVASNQASD